MGERLTSKQEEFARLIAYGEHTDIECLNIAYPSTLAWSKNAQYVRANQYKNTDKIAIRIDELRRSIQAELQKKQLWTREMSVKGLKESYLVAREQRSSAGMTGAIKELNAMHGFNEPKKMDVRVSAVGAVVFAPHTGGDFSEYLPDADD